MASPRDQSTKSSRPANNRAANNYRREIVLAGIIVVLYGAVFGSSMYSLLGGSGAPDPLSLRNEDDPQQPAVAEVLPARSVVSTELAPEPTAAPVAATQPARTIVRVPGPTATPEPAAPQPSTATTAPPATSGPAPVAEVAGVASVSGRHLVVSGDTLSELAELYKIQIGALKLINGLTSDTIYTGQTLVVPRPDEASQLFVSRLGDGGLIGD
jgi:LysM repeat protein